ncbi:MAG: DUF5110 domain-containing protein, partial [candidate division KSB1 bacterium]|nr:DUF5110 domain-containing protein [candidate division KSB1 bacterium]
DKGIPLDTYILDFDWMDWGSDNYGEFRWGPKFPTGPTGQLKADLDSLGVKLLGIRKPRIHLDTQQGNYCQWHGFFVDSTTDYFSGKRVGRLNFHLPAVRQWFWDSFILQGDSYNKGIIGYWNDEADEYGGNLMFLQMQRAQYEGQRQYNNRRVWSINRNFYLGAQRYAYGHWSGDIDTGFDSMADQRLFLLSSIVLGSSWWGMDIGGFQGTPSPENYFRWIQFGAFVPIFRVHGTYGQEREPWHYGPEAEAIASKYIRLRYQLLPYIYSAAWQNHKTGLSIVRPLVMEYPNDDNVINNISEWLFGDDLLVHPIVTPGAATVAIYLPKGQWLDYWTGHCYTGPTELLYQVTREDIPIFVKAGAVIPTSPAGHFADDPETQGLLMLNCYPGSEDSCLLYEDDGLTYDYEKGIYCVTPIWHTQDKSWAVLRIESRQGNFEPPSRDFLAQFHFLETKPDSVLLDGISLEATSAEALRSTATTGWAYETKHRSCLVRFPDDGCAHQVRVALAWDLIPPALDTVFVKADTMVWVQFTEGVSVGQGEISAENISHYTISGGVTVLKATANSQQDAVTLFTTPHQSEVEYTLTVSGIADQSAARNIMAPAQYTYRY